MRVNITITSIAIFIICTATQAQEKVVIEGAVTLANSTDTLAQAGTIRWTGSDFEGWNGTAWVSLTFSASNEVDGDTINEIQTLNKEGNLVSLSMSGGSFTDEINDADADPSNEIQTISKSGNLVTLSNNGGSFSDSINTYSAGEGIVIDNNTISITSSPWHLGQDTLDGIVYYIYQDSMGLDHGLIVSKRLFKNVKWSPTTNNLNKGPISSYDGQFNTDTMDITLHPVKDSIITNLSSDWYLPSIDELILIYTNRFHINRGFDQANVEVIGTNTGFEYWSSTITGATPIAFRFRQGEPFPTSATSGFNVRAIRRF